MPRLHDCVEVGMGTVFYDNSKELAAARRFEVPCMQLIAAACTLGQYSMYGVVGNTVVPAVA